MGYFVAHFSSWDFPDFHLGWNFKMGGVWQCHLLAAVQVFQVAQDCSTILQVFIWKFKCDNVTYCCSPSIPSDPGLLNIITSVLLRTSSTQHRPPPIVPSLVIMQPWSQDSPQTPGWGPSTSGSPTPSWLWWWEWSQSSLSSYLQCAQSAIMYTWGTIGEKLVVEYTPTLLF